MDNSQIPTPLSNSEPGSINELYQKDPLDLTEDELERVVVSLRAQRAQWQQSEVNKAAKPKTKKVSLEDLELEL